jgi:hypothetical protein
MLRNEDILNFGPIGDWFSFEEGMSGCIGWYNRYDVERDVIIYATPHWDEEGVVPFEAIFSDGESRQIIKLYLETRESVEYQLNQYISVISVVLSNFKRI